MQQTPDRLRAASLSFGILIAALTLVILLTPRNGSTVPAPEASDGGVVPGRYIVVLQEGADAEAFTAERGIDADALYGEALNGFAADLSAEDAEALRADLLVTAVEPDRVATLTAQSLPKGIDRVEAEFVSMTGADPAPDVDIAILDTGVDVDHPDLRVAGGASFYGTVYGCGDGTGSYDDEHGHGTQVAGVAAARDNSVGYVGVTPGARIWGVRVFNTGTGYASCIIKGVDWVTANADTIEVANISIGIDDSPALCDAIAASVAAGVVYAVGAGNTGADASQLSPANCASVVTVSAIADSDGRSGGIGPGTAYGADDTLAQFSGRGDSVDIAAPGVGVLSTYAGGGYAIGYGTSFSAPHVAGAVARMIMDGYSGSALGDDVVAAMLAGGWAVPQSSDCGFTGDADGFAEPMLYIGQCNGVEPPSPTPTPPPPPPSPTPTPTPTPAPTPTETPAATETPTPAATATATTTPTPEPVDSDGDGWLDEVDNCPAWPNPDQELPIWTVPAGDVDCDGTPSSKEAHMGTDPLQHCPATPLSLDEDPDAWPPDANDDRDMDIGDIIMLFKNILMTPANYQERSDFTADDQVDVADVIVGFRQFQVVFGSGDACS